MARKKNNEKKNIYKKNRASALYFSSFPKLYKGLLYDRYMFDIFCKGNYKLFIRGCSPLCTYLKTKESYDRWVTRRLWGFRHQISKAKYLKKNI